MSDVEVVFENADDYLDLMEEAWRNGYEAGYEAAARDDS